MTDPYRAAGVTPPQLAEVVSPYRRLYAPLVEFLTDLVQKHPDRPVTVIVSALEARRWYH